MPGSTRLSRRLLIGLAVIVAVLVVAGANGWIVRHFSANAASARNPDSYLTAITCPNAAQCWAVGQVASAPGGNTLSESRAPLLKLETAGRWRTVTAPGVPGRKYALEAIACPGAQDCWAVGGSSAGGSAIIEHWAGGAWQLFASPVLRGGQLNSVACASASACWAIGGTQSRTGTAADVAEQWNGSAWSVAGTLADGLQPEQVSCPAPGRCLVLGLRHGVAAAAAYSGGGWRPAPAPAATIPSLFGCASPAMCLAAFPGSRPVTDAWNGRSWTPVATSLLAYPAGLACSASAGCWLLGTTSRFRPLALRWQRGRWTPVIVRAPRPHGFLTGLACANNCWVVGGTGGARGDGASYTYPLTEPLR
jgi:hypothetical protein